MSVSIKIDDTLTIPAGEIEWRFSMASGPGGGHAAASETRVELRWNVQSSRVLSDAQRYVLLEHLEDRLTEDGLLRITVETERSQHQNREIATDRLVHLVHEALAADRTRWKTEVPAAVREDRLHDKHHHAAIKAARHDPAPEDVDLAGDIDLAEGMDLEG